MSAPQSTTSRPQFKDGHIVFADASSFEREVELMLSHGLLWVGGTEFPPPLNLFEFAIQVPTGGKVPMTGQILSCRQQEALIELHSGADALFRTLLDVRYPQHRSDKRRFPRLPQKLQVRMGNEECLTVDASAGGMCIESDRVCALGTVVTGFVQVNDAALPFQAEVRWCKLGNAAAGKRGRLGVRILSIPAAYYDLFRGVALSTQAAQTATLRQGPAATPAAPPAAQAPAASAATASPPPATPKSGSNVPAEVAPAVQAANAVAAATARSNAATSSTTRRPNERRGIHRKRKRLKVAIGAATGFTFDLSPRGLGVEVGKVLTPGTRVEGILHIDDKQLPFAGQVRWARAGHAGLGVRGRMGILLTSMPEDFFALF